MSTHFGLDVFAGGRPPGPIVCLTSPPQIVHYQRRPRHRATTHPKDRARRDRRVLKETCGLS